ncbi:MAG: hypothetical protein BWY78_01510 [Alphaproteobacteria bacterium ADurb.Bin438]|nr:MAG: hypothetical protein BWY78_01510 [Alphaproteobacteria bacterium ADurb.Bin438]
MVNKLKNLLLIHGSRDDVVPPLAIEISKKVLAGFDITPEVFISEGMRHEINFESQKKALDFLTTNFQG